MQPRLLYDVCTRTRPLNQPGKGSGDRKVCTQNVAQQHRRHGRRRESSGLRLVGQVMARCFWSVGITNNVDMYRPIRALVKVRQPHAFQRGGANRGDDHIGLINQRAQLCAALIALQVRMDNLVTCGHSFIPGAAEGTERVACGWFDLNHPGA